MVGFLRVLLLALPVLVGVAGCGGDPRAEDQSSETAPASDTSPAVPDTSASDTTNAPDTAADAVIVEVMVSGGEVTPADSEVPVPVGSTVQLLFTSDVADEAHVHGYDLTLELPAGEQAQLEFVADIPGVFDVETHEGGQLLCLLRVE